MLFPCHNITTRSDLTIVMALKCKVSPTLMKLINPVSFCKSYLKFLSNGSSTNFEISSTGNLKFNTCSKEFKEGKNAAKFDDTITISQTSVRFNPDEKTVPLFTSSLEELINLLATLQELYIFKE